MGIFVDTGFFLGLVHPKDQNHKKSVRILKEISEGSYGLVYTSHYVISESATIITFRTHNNIDLLNDFYGLVFAKDAFVRILPWQARYFGTIWEILLTHNKKAKSKRELLSFVDASNIMYCREYKIERIIAYDGDFDPYLKRLS